MNNVITIEVISQYGKKRIFPVCDLAKVAMRLTGKKTFSPSDLEVLTELGFVIEVKAPEVPSE